MARKFNLQPWRQALREQQKKQFTIVTAAVAFGMILLCGGFYYLKQDFLEKQVAADNQLQQKIKDLQSTKDEIELTKKLNDEVFKQIIVIQALQSQRSLTVEMLNFIAANTPNTVFLRSLKYDGRTLTIVGTAENKGSVAGYVRVLSRFPYFANVFPQEISQATNNPRYSVSPDTNVNTFTLVMDVVPSVAPLSIRVQGN